jgi:hypothetical protein
MAQCRAMVTHLLADLVGSGLDATDRLLLVIDGAKALSAAVTAVFGARRRSTVPLSTRDGMWLSVRLRTSAAGSTRNWSARCTTPTPRPAYATPAALAEQDHRERQHDQPDRAERSVCDRSGPTAAQSAG